MNRIRRGREESLTGIDTEPRVFRVAWFALCEDLTSRGTPLAGRYVVRPRPTCLVGRKWRARDPVTQDVSLSARSGSSIRMPDGSVQPPVSS